MSTKLKTCLSFLLLVFSAILIAEPGTTENPISEEQIPADSDQQSASGKNAIEQINRYITEQEAEVGAYDPIIAEGLFSLGKAYQQEHRYPEAIQSFKQSLHISKVNYGLYSLAQEPAIREIIKSSQELGDWETTAFGLNTLLTINEKTYGPDDPRMIPILAELTQWHLKAYQRESQVSHLVASNYLSRSAIDLISRYSGENDLRLVNLLKYNALSNYHMAQYLKAHNDFPDQPILFTSARDQLQTDTDEWLMIGNSYRNGRVAYENMINVLYNNPEATLADKAAAYAELGDWFLLFNRKESAFKAYLQAVTIIEDPELRSQIEQQLFQPLQILPITTPENVKDEVNQNKGTLVEVKLDVDEFGTIRNIEVTNLSPAPENADQIASNVKKTLRKARARPLIQNGEVIQREDFVTRIRFEG